MELPGISSTAAAPAVGATTANGAAAGSATGGGLPFGLGAGAAGAYSAQPPGTGSLIKRVLAGGVIGAGLGFGASFLTLPVIGQVAAPLAAAVGGGIGALGGAATWLLARRSANLALEAQAQAAPQQPAPTPMPGNAAAAKASALKYGSKGTAVTTLQKQLGQLGVYKGIATGNYDRNTATAVRRYEVMKGVQPTGLGTSDLRSAVAQDVRLLAQYT